MLETSVTGTRIDDGSQSQLVDAVQSLHQRVLYDIVEQSPRYLDKPENRVVDYLVFVHFGREVTKKPCNKQRFCDIFANKAQNFSSYFFGFHLVI